MKRVRVQTKASCSRSAELVTKLQQDVIPFFECNGVDAHCEGKRMVITASCPSGSAGQFRIVAKAVAARPLLSGRKKRKELADCSFSCPGGQRDFNVWLKPGETASEGCRRRLRKITADPCSELRSRHIQGLGNYKPTPPPTKFPRIRIIREK